MIARALVWARLFLSTRVPAGWANDGTEFEIQFGPSHAVARVALRPFYDPDGERLRS